MTVPTEQDRRLVTAFLSRAKAPTAEAAAVLPFADTPIGLGNHILVTVARADVADPDEWTIDVSD